MAAGGQKFVSVDFEVHGKVQKVFFRKNTKDTADGHGLVGWVQNTDRKTVIGTVQGKADKIRPMKHWLSKVGSKNSRIVKCDFKNERSIDKLEFTDFKIKE